MKEQLEQIRQSTLEALAAAENAADLDAVRIKVLGKKGELTAVLKQMGKLSAEERPVMGQMANAVRAELEAKLTKSIAAEGREAVFADDASHNPKAMELLKNCDSVVLAESLGTTKLSDIEAMLKLAQLAEKLVAGVVTL